MCGKLRVKTMKEKSSDPFMALLSYRSTPLPYLSPAEPKWTLLRSRRRICRSNINRRRILKIVIVVVTLLRSPAMQRSGQNPVRGRVVTASDLPRSYVISTLTGEVRRNRSHLTIFLPNEEAPTEIGPIPEAITRPSPQGQSLTSDIATRTRSQMGTTLHTPNYLRYYGNWSYSL